MSEWRHHCSQDRQLKLDEVHLDAQPSMGKCRVCTKSLTLFSRSFQAWKQLTTGIIQVSKLWTNFPGHFSGTVKWASDFRLSNAKWQRCTEMTAAYRCTCRPTPWLGLRISSCCLLLCCFYVHHIHISQWLHHDGSTIWNILVSISIRMIITVNTDWNLYSLTGINQSVTTTA